MTQLSKNEKSLLMFLETCCVNNGGLIIGSRMNKEDFQNAEKWHSSGFIQFGRIAAADIDFSSVDAKTNWVELSEQAWKLAQDLRKERATRMRNMSSKERLEH